MSGKWINEHSYLSKAGGLFMGSGDGMMDLTTTFKPISASGVMGDGPWKDRIACWGSDNLQPLHLLKLLSESNINPQLLWTKVTLLWVNESSPIRKIFRRILDQVSWLL